MAVYRFETITPAEAANYNAGADTLQFQTATASGAQVIAAYLGGPPAQVGITFNGQTVTFGTGVYGDLDITFPDGSTLFVGGLDADSIAGTGLGDGLFGGQGADTLNGGDGGDLLQGNQGADSLAGGLGDDSIHGGQDSDVITLGGAASTASERNWTNGNRGDDVIDGTPGADTILGGQGTDLLRGGDGADWMFGNLGDDDVHADGGDDLIFGEGGADTLAGGTGADTFVFRTGASDAAVGLLDRVTDWSAFDRIDAGVSPLGYAEIGPITMPGYGGYGGPTYSPTDYNTMLGRTNELMATSPATDIVAAQVDFDVVVFVDSNADNVADLAIVLVGANLTDVDFTSFV
ncbi:calcium-binding protein [Phenylobacterium sp.]|uniref:calcium-binding protein n=1 Tax=Phenylobacterium sp. TaxID=1871053 RepID=UPI002FCA2CDB